MFKKLRDILDPHCLTIISTSTEEMRNGAHADVIHGIHLTIKKSDGDSYRWEMPVNTETETVVIHFMLTRKSRVGEFMLRMKEQFDVVLGYLENPKTGILVVLSYKATEK